MRSSSVLREISAFLKIEKRRTTFQTRVYLAGKVKSSELGGLPKKQKLLATFFQLFIIILRILASAAPISKELSSLTAPTVDIQDD